MTARTPIQITSGWLEGHFIRRIRKAGRCDYWRGMQNGGRCRKPLNVGDLYVEGEMNDDAGGYGHDRYCLTCAGDEALAAVAAVTKATSA